MLSLVLLTLPPPPKKSIRHQFQAAEMFKHANANFRQFRIWSNKKKRWGGYTVSAKLAIIYLDNV